MRLPPAHLSTSNSPSTGGRLPNPNDWPKGLFQILMVVSLAILLSPFLIWFLWKRWNNLGSWKLHKGSNAAERKRYIRTWHGWVEQEKYLQRKEMRSGFRHSMSRKLMWKTTISDYAWVFWDPNGEKQREYLNRRNQTWIRHLPRWMRSYQHGTVQPRSRPLDLNNAEQGIPFDSCVHQTLRIQSSDSISFHKCNRSRADRYNQIDGESTTRIDQICTTLMSGALLDVENECQASTIRHYRKLDRSLQIWRANSVETRRATSRLLFKSNKDTWPHTRNTVIGKTSYSPLAISLITNALSFDKQDHPVASLPSTSWPEPYPMEGSEPSGTPHTSGIDTTWVRHNMVADPISASTENLSGCPNPPAATGLPASVGYQLTGRARHIINSPSERTGSATCGALDKTGTQVMAQTRTKAPSSSFHSDICAYEAEGSLDGAVLSRASSVIAAKDHFSNPSKIQEPWYRKTSACWSDKRKKPVSQRLEFCQASQGGSALWSKAMSGATSNSYATSASRLVHPRRRRLVDRAICASPPSENKFGKRNEVPMVQLDGSPPNTKPSESTERTPSLYSAVNTTKSTTFPEHLYDAESSSCLDRPGDQNAGDALYTIQDLENSCAVLTQQELRFADDLHRRLDRLHYELSPGFRAPTSEEIDKLYFGPVPLSIAGPSADVVGRATQANIRRLSVRRGKIRGSGSDPPRQSQLHRSETQRLNSWRATINKARRLSGGEEMLKYIPNRKVGFMEPEEGAIDVAAWILRRPPQGFPDTNLTQDTLFTGVHGKMRTQAEWNAISMPKTITMSPLKRALSNLSSPRNSTKKLRPVESVVNVRHMWEGHKRNADEFKENMRLTGGPRSLHEGV